MSQFSYEIVLKKGRLHSNAAGLSERTYEPTETPAPTITNTLMDNFVNEVDLGMNGRDFIDYLVQRQMKTRRIILSKTNYNFILRLLRLKMGPRQFKYGYAPSLTFRRV